MDFAILPKETTITNENKHLALGYNPPIMENVDSKLPHPTTTCKYTGSLGKLYKIGRGGVKVYKTKGPKVIGEIASYMKSGLKDDFAQYANIFNSIEGCDDKEKLIVKITPIRTFRDLMTCYKEAMMTYRVYSTERNGVKGVDLVCKPYICAPFNDGKKWYFVFITTRGLGASLDKRYKMFGLMFTGLTESDVYADLDIACDKLWSLGFVHNDMKPDNVMYDVKTRRVTFIDFETSVEMPEDVTSKYIMKRQSSNVGDASSTFHEVMLSTSMNLLKSSEEYLNSYANKEEYIGDVIYNTDCGFLFQLKP
jgi:serine/threonine protein kinase